MESVFQFSNPVLTKMCFSLNEGFDGSVERRLVVKNEFSTQVSCDKEARTALVVLKCKLGEQSDDFPFYIEAEEQAQYRWGLDDAGNKLNIELPDEDMLKKLLTQNAPSLLLSYLRPIIVQITAASPSGAYNIPFMDFSKGVNPDEQN